MNEHIIFSNHNGQPTVSSRDVAEHFGKRHDHVMRDIEEIIAGLPKIGETPLFFKTTYTAANKQEYPMYQMNRDGFTLLAMGFTGKTALEWKLKYIRAFNAMEEQLKVKEIQAAMPKVDARMMEAQARLNNSRVDTAKLLMHLGDKAALKYCREECYQFALFALTGRTIDADAMPTGRLFWLKEKNEN